MRILIALLVSSSLFAAKTQEPGWFTVSNENIFGVSTEVKIGYGFSGFGKFTYWPMPSGKWFGGGVGVRYYITGVTLKNGLYVHYSPAIFQKNKTSLNVIERERVIKNEIMLAYRWNLMDDAVFMFIDTGLGASSNLITGKNPNGLGNITRHEWQPQFLVSWGIGF